MIKTNGRGNNYFEPNLSIVEFLEVHQPTKRNRLSTDEVELRQIYAFSSSGEPPPQIAEYWNVRGRAYKIKTRNYAKK